jgi:hypothetical protein
LRAYFGFPIRTTICTDKLTYGLVATEDKSIAPEIKRTMYKRSNTNVSEIKGSYVIFMSPPEAVAKVIIEATTNAAKIKQAPDA